VRRQHRCRRRCEGERGHAEEDRETVHFVSSFSISAVIAAAVGFTVDARTGEPPSGASRYL